MLHRRCNTTYVCCAVEETDKLLYSFVIVIRPDVMFLLRSLTCV